MENVTKTFNANKLAKVAILSAIAFSTTSAFAEGAVTDMATGTSFTDVIAGVGIVAAGVFGYYAAEFGFKKVIAFFKSK